jgi:hypothetical protein
MKTNISIELNDNERSHLHNIYHNKKSSRLISRKEINNLVNLMLQELLASDVGNYTDVTNNIVEEGVRYYFNDQRVTPDEWQAGIQVWLEKRKQNANQ